MKLSACSQLRSRLLLYAATTRALDPCMDMSKWSISTVGRLIWSNGGLTDDINTCTQLSFSKKACVSIETQQRDNTGAINAVIEALTVCDTVPRQTILSTSPACALSSHAAAGCREVIRDSLAIERTVESLTLFGRGSGPLYYMQEEQAA